MGNDKPVMSRQALSYSRCLWCLFLFFFTGFVSGCGDKVPTPTPRQMKAFEEAGPKRPKVDMDLIERARLHAGPYRVVSGDVLEFTMPALLQAVTAAELQAAQSQIEEDRPYLCRVNPRGAIVLPAVSELEVAGLSLAEVEEKVADAYRRYATLQPLVFVRILEYDTYPVAVLGAVAEPGIYELRHDQMSLVALLMAAGGIAENGAALIRIARLDETGTSPSGAQIPMGAQQTRCLPDGAFGDASLASSAPTANGSPNKAMRGYVAEAVFQQEGSLCASGWLTVKRRDELIVRRWLDLANDLQREAFLGTLALKSPQIRMEDFQMKLSQLAGYLDSHPPNSSAVQAVQIPGWQVTGNGQFAAHLPGVLLDTDAGVTRTADALAEGNSFQVAAAGAAGEVMPTSLVLPVVGCSIPFRDVALKQGDTVVVEPVEVPLFSVLGLVNRPGNFPYPPNAEYNVTQAIAFAQGLDVTANPRYVTIYRLAKDGSIARVSLRLIEDNELTDALKTAILPGDVVAVEHTQRTRANVMIHDLLRFNIGVYISGRDLWRND
ncbi:MAG: SLBB domain-containing protein [Anaerolineae bacterium]|nr:SLBB domain-containing protein [Anaerolineae bacterium]